VTSADAINKLVLRLRRLVADEISKTIDAAHKNQKPVPDQQDQQLMAGSILLAELNRYARSRIQAGELALTDAEEADVRRRVMELVFSTAPGIERLLQREDVEEILVNGFDDVRLVLTNGTTVREEPIGGSDEELIETIQALARRGGSSEKEFTPSSPVLDLTLSDGSRLCAAAWVTRRPYITIRRHIDLLIDANVSDLIQLGYFEPGVASLLSAAVRARKNMLVAGGQGAGKTSLMRALLRECHPDERILVLEQEPELQLERQPERNNHVLSFVTRLPNMEGVGEVTLADLAKLIKRFRPERIVVGEVRGPEVIDMLESLTQGIAGGICTMHADSSLGVFQRLSVYARAGGRDWRTSDVLSLASLGIHLVVFLARDRDGRRCVAEIRHVEAFDQQHDQIITNPWFSPGPDGRATPNPTSPIPVDLVEELMAYGYNPSLHYGVGVR
jgi:Flp pilus assembly CpaF family ATPase